MDGERIEILLVEDEEAHAELVRRAFASQDERVALSVVPTLCEARAALEEAARELVIADMLLPDGNCMELLPDQGEEPQFPMVVMTSFGNEQAAVEAMKRGALDYVAKSEATLTNMPHIARRALREWRHITERKQAQQELKNARDQLEKRVKQRTAELQNTNRWLRREIAERKRAEEALVRAEHLASIGTMAAGIAHEINNPLAAIALYCAVATHAKDRPNAAETIDDALENIREQTFRCGEIIRNVLRFAREGEAEKWPCNLGNVARGARELVGRRAAEKGVAVEVKLGDELPEIVVSPTGIEQVIVNLVCNAIEASEPGGSVNVRIEPHGDSVRLSVEDRGRGMTKEQLARAFDPFYTGRRYEGGNGLGLAITHSIVQEHAGSIDIRSRPGEGTTVAVLLPVNPTETQKADT